VKLDAARLRLEEYSDGVFAIAITLLVLSPKVPLPGMPGLGIMPAIDTLSRGFDSQLADQGSVVNTSLMGWIGSFIPL
jgi:transmembrane protein TMEM174 (potassium channel)